MMSPLGNKKLGSCGALFSRTKAKVMDLETGERALGPYEDGELFVTGPQVMKLKELIKVKAFQVN